MQAGDKVIAVVERVATTNTRQYLHRDHQGSVVKVTNASGTVDQALAFDAWGLRRNASDWSALGSPLAGSHEIERGYTGHEHLDQVGLIHMNGRVQDPILGRFISADPFVQAPYDTQSHNRYSYVWNNPASLIDPSGFDAEAAQQLHDRMMSDDFQCDPQECRELYDFLCGIFGQCMTVTASMSGNDRYVPMFGIRLPTFDDSWVGGGGGGGGGGFGLGQGGAAPGVSDGAASTNDGQFMGQQQPSPSSAASDFLGALGIDISQVTLHSIVQEGPGWRPREGSFELGVGVVISGPARFGDMRVDFTNAALGLVVTYSGDQRALQFFMNHGLANMRGPAGTRVRVFSFDTSFNFVENGVQTAGAIQYSRGFLSFGPDNARRDYSFNLTGPNIGSTLDSLESGFTSHYLGRGD